MIICIVGPTGVGKTKLSIQLAKKYKAKVINCDAMQVYKGMDIGTAKIKESEKENIEHYLFDFVSVTKNYTVYDYQKDAREILEKYRGENIIMVGGTGLYLKAALYNYSFREEQGSCETFDNLSNEELYSLALKKDSKMNIHKNNRKRLVRFLNKKDTRQEPAYPLYEAIYIGLTTDRNGLYQRINDRVEQMIQEGLVKEVEAFYKQNKDSKALETAIGYKELYKYFRGEISLEEAIDLIKKNSRHYAKRQYTWFNNQMNVNWLMVNFQDFNKTVDEAIKLIEYQKK